LLPHASIAVNRSLFAQGAKILCRAALADEFAAASGQYFDNDSGEFAPPHADALDARKSAAVSRAIEAVLVEVLQSDAKRGRRD